MNESFDLEQIVLRLARRIVALERELARVRPDCFIPDAAMPAYREYEDELSAPVVRLILPDRKP